MKFISRNKSKVFCVGKNKTGTTSIAAALKMLDYKVGNQAEAELLIDDWAKRDFHRIIRYCHSADGFQDIPFSLDYTYQALDMSFPRSRFILTIRNSAEEWFQSLTRFHTSIVGKDRLPTVDDLKEFPYRYKGWLWDAHRIVYGIDENTLYNQEIYISHYVNHNQKVVDYFRHRSTDLLVLNLAEPDAFEKLCIFLNIKYEGQIMPHENKSQ